MKFRLFIIPLIFSAWGLSYSQDIKTDTIHVRGKSFISLGDSTLFIERDTIITLPDSVAAKFKKTKQARNGDQFYKQVKTTFYKNKFTKELYDVLFVDPDKTKGGKTVKKPLASPPDYKQYEGQIINSITLEKPEVFQYITNPEKANKAGVWAANVGNKVHVNTKDRVILNAIFFKVGDIVDEHLIIDSERILRNLPYIRDARIYISSSASGSGVDVLIIVKDMWTLVPNFRYSSLTNYGVELIERNFMGYGHQLSFGVSYNSSYTQTTGYDASYRVFNIQNTFIDAEVQYTNSQPINQYGIRFNRDFVTPETKFAGGVSFFRKDVERSFILPDTTIVFRTDYNEQDAWIGRSIKFSEDKKLARVNMQIAARFNRTKYETRPLVTSDTNRLFQNRNLGLISAGITRRNYEKSSLISGYGRTEDIPVGFLGEFTLGYETNEFYNRPYIGGRVAFGQYYKHLGYFRPSISLGRFIHNGKTEQGVAKLQLFYFSYLYKMRRYNYRQFLKLSYTVGQNRYYHEYVYINNGEGLRDISNPLLRGVKKLAFSAETVAFTPIYMVGFRFVFYTFVDLAIIDDQHPNLFKNTLYQGYGIGLRLRNENIAFNTLNFRIGYYPIVPPDNDQFNFRFSNMPINLLTDFQTREPEVVEFR